MRRLIATLVVSALALSSSMGSALHVHEYLGHDHPDHHHGPATHEHLLNAVADQDRQVATGGNPAVEPVSSHDPGRHAVNISVGAVCGQSVRMDLAIEPGPIVVDPSAPFCPALAPAEVRAHGPPAAALPAPRAPPVSHLA